MPFAVPPSHACPQCHAPADYLPGVSADAFRIDYFRCGVCAIVFTVDRVSHDVDIRTVRLTPQRGAGR